MFTDRGSDLTLNSPVWRRKPERGVLGFLRDEPRKGRNNYTGSFAPPEAQQFLSSLSPRVPAKAFGQRFHTGLIRV